MLEIILVWFVMSLVLGLLVGRGIYLMGKPSEDSEIPAALDSLRGNRSPVNMIGLSMGEGSQRTTAENEPVVMDVGYRPRAIHN